MVKRILYSAPVILLSLLLLIRCNNDTSPIGAGIISTAQFDVSEVDTVTVRASTVVYDSIATSSPYGGSATGRLLIGHHTDPKLGSITSSNAFTLSPPSPYKLDPFQTTYKALSMYFKRDKYFYYDTTQQMTLYVYRLTQPITFYFGSRYNVDNYSFDNSSPLGTLTIYPHPHSTDSVEVFLSDDLGRELMAKAQSGDQFLQNLDNFSKYIYGFALRPDTTTNTTFIGFKPSPVMRLYYNDLSVLPGYNPEKHLTFAMSPLNQFYNKITADRSGTKVASLHGLGDEVRSPASDNEFYVQGGSGLAMRITAPYLKNLSNLDNSFIASRAIMTLTPVWSSVSPFTPPPSTLNADLIDQNYLLVSSGFLASAGLSTDLLGNRSYTFDVTNYVNSEVFKATPGVNSLILKIPDLNSTVNRLYLGDAANQFQLKLKVYYITLSEQ